MNSAQFQLNKVKRLINTQGISVQILREGKNKFNEPNGEAETFNITGVFHEGTSYISKMSADSSTTHSKSSPMFLTLWEQGKSLRITDKISLNGNLYQINGIKNLSECNLICDISMEEIQAYAEV